MVSFATRRHRKVPVMDAILLLAGGSVFFPLCFICVQRIITHMQLKRLSEANISNISVKCVSSLQALMSTCVGYIIMSSCQDIMHDRHWLSNSYAWFAVPYFYYDTWAMYQNHHVLHSYTAEKSTLIRFIHFFKRNQIMMVHHIVMPLVFLPTILFFRQGRGDFFVGVFYMIEIAVPFIALWSITIDLKLKNSLYSFVTGLMMIFVFGVTRLLVFPYLFWCYSNYKKVAFWAIPGIIPIKCNVGCLFLLLPQLYWLGLMVKGAWKVFFKAASVERVSCDSLGKPK